MPEILPNISGIIANWGKWSKIVAFKLAGIMFGSITFENILSIRVVEWMVVKLIVQNEFEAIESETSFAWSCLL